MYIYRNLLIGMVVCITILSLYQLILARHHIYQQTHSFGGIQETFTLFSNPASEYQSITSSYSDSVKVSNATNTNLPLQEYCIKSSYHSARSGYYVSKEMLTWVLSRGCRYIDLEIHLQNNAPVVTFSNASNQILLHDMLSVLMIHGFSGPSPNPKDPLLLNLRIIKDDTNSIYQLVGMVIQNVLDARLYRGKVTGQTNLGEVKEKIILCCDQSMDPDFLNLQHYTNCETETHLENSSCYALSKFINIQSGSDILQTMSASGINSMCIVHPPIITTDGISDIQTWKIVEPDENNTTINTKTMPLIKNYGIQIVTNMYYVADGQIKQYETFFDEQGVAFVPFSIALPYAKKHSE
jgi:Phosphatidylinositol-specific phospholipase C, X domain